MNFAEHPPSKQWSALKYQGLKFAEVWFKPAGEPLALAFRIPRESFQIPGMDQQLTIENLVKAVGVAPEQVESWRQDNLTHSGNHGSQFDLSKPLAPPSQGAYVEMEVRLHRPATPPSLTPDSSFMTADSLAIWHDLDARWKTILSLEASMDALRISMETLLHELEAAWKKPLTMEEKTYAPRADVAQWTKAKNRVHVAVPKMKEFIHRSVWVVGEPERKRLGELYEKHIQPQVPFAHIDEVVKQMEGLRKDRQVLAAQGKMVYQECRGIAAEVHGALRTLQSNAANARRKKGGKS